MSELEKEATVQEKAQKRKKQSMAYVVVHRLVRNKLAMFGLVVILIMALMAIFAPYIAPYSYTKTDIMNMYAAPSKEHLLGCDELGRDIFSRLLYGARYSLSIGVIVVAISSVIGICVGAIVGYYGGTLDTIFMRFMDIFQAIPNLVLAIAISAALGPGFKNCVLALTISQIPGYVRMTRASVMNVRKMEYLEAATAINCKNSRIIFKHVLPNAISPMLVQMTMGIAGGIMAASSLSFVGLGVQPPEPEWGAMLSAGRNFIRDYPHMCLVPGITIMIAILAFNIFGDGLRDALDPKLKD